MANELEGDPQAAPQARRLIGELDRLPASVRDDAELLVTELISNAVLHGDFHEADRLSVETELSGSKLRVEVVNPGWEDVPHLKNPDPFDPDGRGMILVDRLADAWGVDVLEDERLKVWFELSL